MSKKKGLSFDEKKATLLGAMHAEASFYTLKELEALGKAKGVIPQAVKEVVEALGADGMVNNDRVGSQQIFWALKSDRACAMRGKKRRLEEELAKLQADRRKAVAEIEELGKSAEPVPSEEQASALLEKTAASKKRCVELKDQISTLRKCGPGRLNEMREQSVIAKQAANRWADNIEGVRTKVLRESRGEVKAGQFNQAFNLPEEFEELE